MKTKEAFVEKLEFPKSLTNLVKPLVISFGSAHTKINEEIVDQALMTQAATKASNPDKINFQILKII